SNLRLALLFAQAAQLAVDLDAYPRVVLHLRQIGAEDLAVLSNLRGLRCDVLLDLLVDCLLFCVDALSGWRGCWCSIGARRSNHSIDAGGFLSLGRLGTVMGGAIGIHPLVDLAGH